MAVSELFPIVGTLPPGYNVSIVIDGTRFSRKMLDTTANGTLQWRFRLRYESEIERVEEGELAYSGTSFDPDQLCINIAAEPCEMGETLKFYEFDFIESSGRPIFNSKMLSIGYAFYWAPGKKSFLAEIGQKFGLPSVISQVASLGQFLQSYPSVLVDKDMDYGQSVTMINPYLKPIVAKVTTNDGRTFPRVRIPAESARNLRIADIMEPHERRWVGDIQVTANNRVVLYDFKHKLSDPTLVTDHEHLDYYQVNDSYEPAFPHFRHKVAMFLQKFGLLERRWFLQTQ
jgi:hypothetical protein